MPSSRLLLSSVGVVLALASARVEAAAWDQPFSAEPQELLAATAGLPSEPGDGVVMLLEDTRLSLDEQARAEITHRRIFRVLDDAGVSAWGSLGASWEPWRQARPMLRARVIRPDGSVRDLDPATIDEAPAHDDLPDVLTSTRVLRAPLPSLAAGCVVEQEVVTRDEAPIVKGLYSTTAWMGSYLPIASSRFVVDAPAGLPLRTFARRVPVAPEREERDGRVLIAWRWPAVPRDEPRLRLLPLGIPTTPHVSVTTAASWGEVATAYAAIIDERARIEDVAARAQAVAGDAPDARAAAARCLADIHASVRYTGLEFGEAAIVPVAPATCLERGYGDCKDKATLLVAMLRALGHRADVALLMPGRPYEIDPEVPGIAAFTHAIVAVGDPPLFIDATAPEAAVGELPAMDRGHLALVARRDVTALVQVPPTSPGTDRVAEVVDVVLAEDGPASVVETTQSWGEFAVSDRAVHLGETDEDVIRRLTPYAQQVYGATSVAEPEASAAGDLTAPTSLRFRAVAPSRTWGEWPLAGVALTYGGWLPEVLGLVGEDEKEEDEPEVPRTPFAMRLRQVEENRTEPIVLPRNFAFERIYHVVPPPGHELVSPPGIEAWTEGPMSFTAETKAAADGSVDVTMRFSTGDGRLTPVQAKSLGARLKSMYESDRPVVTYRAVASRLLEEGDVRGALAELRRLAAMHPAEALHHVHLADALLAVGLGEAARREAQRAVELEPKSALALRMQAFVLQRDLLGRVHAPGADIPGALAALRGAKEADPEDAAARRMLADLVGREAGVPSWDPAKARAEADEWRSMKADLGDEAGDVDGRLSAALYRAGDHAGILAMSEAAGDERSEQLDVIALCSIAVREGVPVALRRAAAPPFDERNRSALLESVGATLVQGRYYPEAAAMFAEAARGSDHATVLGARADRTRSLHRHDGGKLGDGDPGSVVRSFLAASSQADPAGVEQFVDLTAFGDQRADFVKGVTLGMARARASLAASGLSNDVFLDILASGCDVIPEPDGADGARVRVRFTGLGGDMRSDYFVRRRGERWQLVAFDTAPPMLGSVALEHAAAGRVELARRWLDWAREAWVADGPGLPAFGASWTRGQEADAAACRLAAAILLAPLDVSGQARSELAAARDAATGDVRRRIDEAIALAHAGVRDFEAAVAAARPLAEAERELGAGTLVLAQALFHLERAGEVADFVKRKMEVVPASEAFERLLVDATMQAGRLDEAMATLRAIEARGASAPNDHNNVAWLGLIMGAAPATLIDDAQAATAGASPAPSALHTLASVLVEVGRLHEARQALLQRFELDAGGEPEAADWYVLGRLAEEYGETDAAREALERVLAEDDESPTATRVLAQRRLEKLATPAAPPIAAAPG